MGIFFVYSYSRNNLFVMKKTLLVSLSVLLGSFSLAFAASTSNVLDGDLFFYDEVMITSGVTYQSDLDGDTGSANVKFEGDGSLTIGRRLGDGFPRVAIYSGTTLTVSQDFSGKADKNWWAGKVKAPNRVLNVPVNLFKWENESNHKKIGESVDGETKVAVSYGFESATETYKFSSPAYIVLPVNAPDNAKIWYVFHNIDPEDYADAQPVEIKEDNFCVVQDNLCVIPVTEMNEVALIEESFERCPRKEVPNGSVGSIPYCVITCNQGYELDESAIACTESEGGATNGSGETSLPAETNHESAPTGGNNNFAGLSGDELKQAIEEARLQAIGKKSYHSGHYTGDTLQLIDTSNLSGEELRNALRRNAEINRRRGLENKRKTDDSEVSFLKKALNDIRGTLWSWENAKSQKAKTIASAADTEQNQELELASNGENMGESESFSGHASAPLLPSSGSSTIFIIISILGIGLMLLAFKRN